jgi:sterol desaturase/sphingolipid hydroxylase (fatty acid hydroxylase superfamily)
MLDQAWFLTFWGALAILAALEVLIPESPAPAERSRRWPVNLGLAIFNALLFSLVPALSVSAAQWAALRHIGLLNQISAPAWAAFPIAITVQSLAFYGFHLWSHANPILWRLHRVHHGDPYLDATTSLRHHPFEMIASVLILTPIYVICGLSPVAVAVYEMAEALFGLLTHANLPLPERTERVLRALFVTPPYHRVHHSIVRAETDSNYAGVFSFWDRLFGTYRGEAIDAGRRIVFGLEEFDGDQADDILDQLKSPWRA